MAKTPPPAETEQEKELTKKTQQLAEKEKEVTEKEKKATEKEKKVMEKEKKVAEKEKEVAEKEKKATEKEKEVAEKEKELPEKLPEQVSMHMGFLKERTGKTSNTRVMSFLALLASIWFAWMTLSKNVPSENGVYITTAFLLAAFAPKVFQKYVEETAIIENMLGKQKKNTQASPQK